ncbi:energy-coupling factor ABC transporter ATP-binding protein [Periweissella cryptocerci]|uniref:Energy-coupling factor transporter ATP-binding protein EcfA2 n=1 Tax=Periweissella cryptocerci TaxID=2506420 RepID=A0A4P6YTF9_9LACO|nr:energy-coupling factor ABC transporter ATP-binding protein [Periweissella cryptocerci]QBO35971.1 energy-coupling factor ABC transporter ATP-binding protein [Periweissella cryptocerci]
MAIEFQQVDFIYQPNSPFATSALKDVNFTIPTGSFTAVIGHTGSGKSTMLQHLDGLLKPTEGTVVIDDMTITSATSQKELAKLRSHVGIVFQFPENQLFEQTVVKDVMFGPINFGKSEAEAKTMAEEALRLVGLPEHLWENSPFDLSGGQMRRVAIAGVLAMQPEILVLDEPTAGLDPLGRREIMGMFYDLYKKSNLTVVLVTHQMEDVANFADNVVVMENGTVVKQGTPQEVFHDVAWLEEKRLDVPMTTLFANQLVAQGFNFTELPYTVADLAKELAQQLIPGKGGQN